LVAEGRAEEVLGGGQALVGLDHAVFEGGERGAGEGLENGVGAFEVKFGGVGRAVHGDGHGAGEETLGVVENEGFALLLREGAEGADEGEILGVGVGGGQESFVLQSGLVLGGAPGDEDGVVVEPSLGRVGVAPGGEVVDGLLDDEVDDAVADVWAAGEAVGHAVNEG